MTITEFKNTDNIGDLDFKKCDDVGLELLLANQVGVIVLAGGQGSRLGLNKPKGTLLLNGQSLFEMQAKKINKLTSTLNIRIPWYIMTSCKTHTDTINFFKENNYFNLLKEDVIFFQQGNNYCIDKHNNKIKQGYDNNNNSIYATCPNGNGGIYKAIHESGIIYDFEKRGLKYIHIYNVDNILVKIADSLFIGYNKIYDLDVSAKVCPKNDPEEKVGVYCYKDNKPSIIEYFELSEEMRNMKKKDGSLVYNQGNISIYCLSVEFIKRTINYKLPLHNAHKKIPYWDNDLKKLIKPSKENGYKPEYFIFDVFKYCEPEKMRLLETNRETEFCPIKKKEDITIALNYLQH